MRTQEMMNWMYIETTGEQENAIGLYGVEEVNVVNYNSRNKTGYSYV